MKIKQTNHFVVFLFFMLFLVPITTFADEQRVFDDAHLFSEEERTDLQATIDKIIATSNMDAVIVTTTDTDGKTTEEFADDYYDFNGFGKDKNKSGLLFLIDITTREFHISTTGEMIAILSDKRIDEMKDNFTPAMREGDYASAADLVLEDMQTYIRKGPPAGNYYDAASGTVKHKKTIQSFEAIIAVIVAIIAGSAFYGGIFSTYSLKKGTYKYPYRDKGYLQLDKREDQLINTYTTSRRIPRSNSGGGSGGSSTHTSSSGTSHGGGGGRF